MISSSNMNVYQVQQSNAQLDIANYLAQKNEMVKRLNGKNVLNWNTQEVGLWLESIGLNSFYVQRFAYMGLAGNNLAYLDRSHLYGVGIVHPRDQAGLLQAVSGLLSKYGVAMAKQQPVAQSQVAQPQYLVATAVQPTSAPVAPASATANTSDASCNSSEAGSVVAQPAVTGYTMVQVPINYQQAQQAQAHAAGFQMLGMQRGQSFVAVNSPNNSARSEPWEGGMDPWSCGPPLSPPVEVANDLSHLYTDLSLSPQTASYGLERIRDPNPFAAAAIHEQQKYAMALWQKQRELEERRLEAERRVKAAEAQHAKLLVAQAQVAASQAAAPPATPPAENDAAGTAAAPSVESYEYTPPAGTIPKRSPVETERRPPAVEPLPPATNSKNECRMPKPSPHLSFSTPALVFDATNYPTLPRRRSGTNSPNPAPAARKGGVSREVRALTRKTCWGSKPAAAKPLRVVPTKPLRQAEKATILSLLPESKRKMKKQGGAVFANTEEEFPALPNRRGGAKRSAATRPPAKTNTRKSNSVHQPRRHEVPAVKLNTLSDPWLEADLKPKVHTPAPLVKNE